MKTAFSGVSIRAGINGSAIGTLEVQCETLITAERRQRSKERLHATPVAFENSGCLKLIRVLIRKTNR